MKKGGSSKSTIIIGPSKSVLVYVLHSLEYVLGLARFRVFVPKFLFIVNIFSIIYVISNKTAYKFFVSPKIFDFDQNLYRCLFVPVLRFICIFFCKNDSIL